jgi:hypothetical protein
MKTLRRPMFRKGGEVGGGIMTGINRNNYSTGTTPRERYEAIVQKYAQPAVDPISQLLIQGGLRGMSQTGGGGTLGNLAMAFEQPTAQLFQNLQRQKDVKRETELAGLEMDLAEEDRLKRIAAEKEAREADEKFQLDLLGKKQKFEEGQSELDRALQLQIAQLPGKSGTGMQKDYSPERIYFESFQKYTDPKAAGYITSIQQEYPEAFAEFAAYIGPSIRQNDDLKAGFIGVLPNKKKGKTRQYNFDEMIPGGIYFKPDTKRLYERDSEQNILIEYDPYSGKKLREIPLG